MRNKIEDLRDHLFATLEALRDDEKPMDLARAREIANVGRAIIESAKVEVDFLRVTGGTRATDFLPTDDDERNPPRVGRAAKGAAMLPAATSRSGSGDT